MSNVAWFVTVKRSTRTLFGNVFLDSRFISEEEGRVEGWKWITILPKGIFILISRWSHYLIWLQTPAYINLWVGWSAQTRDFAISFQKGFWVAGNRDEVVALAMVVWEHNHFLGHFTTNHRTHAMSPLCDGWMPECLNACTVPISDEVQIGSWMDFGGWRVVGLFLYYVENCIFWFSFAIKIRHKENERKKDYFKTIWAILFIKLLTLWCFFFVTFIGCNMQNITRHSTIQGDRQTCSR